MKKDTYTFKKHLRRAFQEAFGWTCVQCDKDLTHNERKYNNHRCDFCQMQQDARHDNEFN